MRCFVPYRPPGNNTFLESKDNHIQEMVPGGLQNTELTVEIPPRCKDPRIQKTTGFRLT